MSDASELIERMERESGQRIEANNGKNSATAGISREIARLMGKTSPTNQDVSGPKTVNKLSKVHYTVFPPCNCRKRWASSQITSTRNPQAVTCKNCLRIISAETAGVSSI